MQRPVRAQRRHTVARGVVAASGGDDVDRAGEWGAGRHPAHEPLGELGHGGGPGVRAVGSLLEVARVLRRRAVDDAGVGRADDVVGALALGGVGEAVDELRHRGAERGERHGLVAHRDGVGPGQRLEVRQERARGGDVALGLGVVPAVDRVVGALEEQALAVLDELVGPVRVEAERGPRHDRGGGDVVLGLHLHGGGEVVAQAEQAPRPVDVVADPQHVERDLHAVEVQRVALPPVDLGHAEVAAPVVAPLRAVGPLDDVDELLDVRGDARQPGVVLGRVLGR